MLRRLVVPVVLAALLAAPVAGCGSTVAPKTWAKSVCTALSPWRTQINDLTTRAREQLAGATTAAQAKQNLGALLTGARDVSERARREVDSAGVPDVDNGKQIAGSFVAALAAARDAYAHAGATVSKLDTREAKAFYDAVALAFDRLNREYAASALDTSQVGSAPLKNAFAEVAECR